MLSTASDLLLVVLVMLAAFLFFGLIPGIGAFAVRGQWRRFRRKIQESSLFPFVRYSDLSAGTPEAGGYLGSFRAFGSLEALQGKNRIWLDTGRSTVAVDLEGVRLYLLPSFSTPASHSPLERLEESVPDEEPATVSWDRIYSLPGGTQIFVAGPLLAEEGQAVFRSRPRDPLLVVIYDGEESSILQRAIRSGRQKNEYWNQYTLASLLTGSFCLVLLAFLLLRTRGGGLPALVALTLAFFPIAALLPPGVVLYYLYRYFWKKGRLLRAERDLLRLPVRYFEQAPRPSRSGDGPEACILLPTGERYVRSEGFRRLVRGAPTIRGYRFAARAEQRRQAYTLFGADDRAEEAPALRVPEDPMAELVLVLGDPVELARASDRRSLLYALLSACLMFGALAVNLFLLLVIWHLIIR
jgi:hypothetical protein